MERLTSIDLCRGIAIMCMVVADFPSNTDIGIVKNFTAILAAPFFLFISGISYELYIVARHNQNIEEKTLHIETFWKAIILLGITQFIFLLGVLLFPSHFSFGFNSNIFSVIAVGYLISIYIPSKWQYHISIILILFASFYFINSSISDFFSFLFSAPFPIIPFLAYFFAGRFIMIIYHGMNDPQMKDKKMLFGSIIFTLIMALFFLQFMAPLSKTSRTYFLGFLLITGLIMSVTAFFNIYNKKNILYNIILLPFERIGRVALSFYYVFFLLQLTLFTFITNVAISKLSPFIQIIIYYLLIICIIIIAANFEKIWRKFEYKFGFEWLTRNLLKMIIKKYY